MNINNIITIRTDTRKTWRHAFCFLFPFCRFSQRSDACHVCFGRSPFPVSRSAVLASRMFFSVSCGDFTTLSPTVISNEHWIIKTIHWMSPLWQYLDPDLDLDLSLYIYIYIYYIWFILLWKLYKQFPVEQFEASRAIRGSNISVSSTLPS